MLRFAASPSLHRIVPMMVLAVIVSAGCSTTPKQSQVVPNDNTLSRHVADGREAFIEGQIAVAEKKYRQALMRAWAIDDPYESGTVAYNLAACLVSDGRLAEASDWLVDARVELCRAGSSTGNTWLLSAEIAMAEHRFADADRFVNYAALICPPCEIDESNCLCGPSEDCCEEPCRDCCAACIPCLGKKLQSKQDQQRCQSGYEARIELARARLAAKQFDVANAEHHLARACELTHDSCDLSLHADRHDVAALVHEIRADFLHAGAHRDREVRLLRCIGHYREIPNVLDAAADAYFSAERYDLAVDRMIRSARIHLARGDAKSAWERIEAAGELACERPCEAVQIRLGLTAKVIRDALPDPDAASSTSATDQTTLRDELENGVPLELLPP